MSPGGPGMSRCALLGCLAVLVVCGLATAQPDFPPVVAPINPPVAPPPVNDPTATELPVVQIQGTVPSTLPPPNTGLLPAAPIEAKPPTLEELGKKVEALSKNLTVTTGDEHFKLVLGGAVTADFLYSTERPVAP